MSIRQEGVVLLTTIVMIVLLTTLILSLMQAVFLYIKVCHRVVSKHDSFYQLEAVADKLSMAKNNVNCMVVTEDPNQVIEMLLHNHKCSLTDNNRDYDYLIDDLGVFPCLLIASGKKRYSSHHWLITVATSPPQQDILQLRIATPVRAMACELLDEQQINMGMISWRYLPYKSTH